MPFEMQRALRAPVLRAMTRGRSANLRRTLLAGASAALLGLPAPAHAVDFPYTGGAGQASTTGSINTVNLSNATITNTASQWTDNGANNELTIVMAGGLANGSGTISRLLGNNLTINNTTASTNRAGIALTLGQGHNLSSQSPVGLFLTGTNAITYSTVESTVGLGAAIYATQTNTVGTNSTNNTIDSSGGTTAFTGNTGIYLNQLGGSASIVTSATDTLTAIAGSTGNGLDMRIANYGNAFIINRASTTNQFGGYGLNYSNSTSGFLALSNSGALNGATGAINAINSGAGPIRLGYDPTLATLSGLTGAMTGGITAQLTVASTIEIVTAAGGTISTATTSSAAGISATGAGNSTLNITTGAAITAPGAAVDGIITSAGAASINTIIANADITAGRRGIDVSHNTGSAAVTVGTGATVTGPTHGIRTTGSGVATLNINGRVDGIIVTGTGNDAITLTSSGVATDGVVTGTIDGGTGTNGLTFAGTSTTATRDISTLSNFATITKSGSGTWSITGTSAINPTYTVSAGTLQLGSAGTSGTLGSGAVSIATAGTLAFNRTDTITIANVIQNSAGGQNGNLTQAGTGTTILTGANTYSGTTTISAGTLQVGANGTVGTLGTGGVTNNAALTFNRSDAITVANTISGTGSLTKLGAGTLSLTGTNTYQGGTTVTAGAISINNNSALGTGTVTLNGTTLQNSALVNALPNAIAIGAAGGTIANNGSNFTINGAIQNAVASPGTLNILGTGGSVVLLQASANTYSGPIVVGDGANAMVLAYTGANGLNSGSTLTVNALAEVNIGNSSQTIAALSGAGQVYANFSSPTLTAGGDNSSTTFSGVMSNGASTFAFTKAGTGTMTLTGANTYSGTTTISAGTLQVGAGGTAGTLGSGNVTNNAALVFNRSDASAYNGVISGSGSVTKSAAGTLTLTGVQTYTGATTINGGTLALTGSGTIADSSGVDLTGAILNISATTTGISVKKVTGASGNIVLGSKTLTITGAGTNYGGVFSGAGGNLIFNGNAILSGTNSADGNATIASGVTVTLGAGGTLGTISNTAMNNSGTLAVNHAAGASINIFTNISGTGGITLLATNAETVALTGTNSYSGLTDIQGGSLTLNNLPGVSANTTFNVGANGLLRLTSISPTLGNVTGSGTVLINKIGPGAPQTLSLNGANFTGTINEATAGQQLVAASGTSILAGNNNWTGSTTINAGATLQIGNGGTTGTIPTGAFVNNGTLAFSRSDNVTFAGAPTGTGGISQRGTGTLFLTGTGTSTGVNSVTAGILSVNGSTAGAVNVGNGGTLKGAGTIGGIANASGGTVAPGNSIGTLTVNGNVSFAAGSIYQVEVDAAGAADRIAATGTATINGGTVDVQAAAGTYGTSTTYTILTATGGVTGTFTNATSNFIFLTPTLNYSASQVTLTLAQPAVVVPPVVVPPVVLPPAPLTFPSVALTPNQIASSTALQTGGAAGGELFLAVLNSTSAVTARSAFDATSGEIHATLQAAQFENATGVRRTLINRMRARSSDAGWSLWGNVTGNWGSIDGDGNAARATNRGVAITVGADTRIDDNWRGGFSGGYTGSEVGVGARRSSANLSGGQFAAYASGKYDAILIRTGFAYGFATASSRRDVGFALFNDALTAKQDVDSQQLFGEVGYDFALTGVTIEPFAGLSWTRVNAGSFRETGGSAALGGNGSARDDGFSTLGAQLFTGGSDFAGGILTPSVRVGWQHAFTNRLATRSLSFLASGQNFTVFGTPLDADRAVIDLDASLALGGTTVTIGYAGSLSRRVEDHGIRLMASVGL